MLDVRGLTVSYGKHVALHDAALRVAKGEIVVILGANGAGKTSLLKAVCGVSEGQVGGSVTIEGTEIIGQPPHRIVEEGIALVPEGRGIFGEMTVEENLRLGAYAERARDEAAGNLDRVYHLFPKLLERRRQLARTMSGGEQQMVAIGRAMMSNPAILALDEPSLGLSPLLCKDLFQSLKAVRAAGLGMLLVEQNARASLAIADRGYLLENGRIVHQDRAEALLNDPAVQRAYLGGAAAKPVVAASLPRPAPAPRPASASPSDIAAAALKSVAPRAPAPPTAPAPPSRPGKGPEAPPAAAPTATDPRQIDTAALVARAAAASDRRAKPNGPARPAAPVDRPAATPMPDLAPSADRLQTILSEIEAAARKAETYRPNPKKRS